MALEDDFDTRSGDPRPVLRPQPPASQSEVQVEAAVLDRVTVTVLALPDRD